MGSNTNNLNLYKANPVEDANDTFNIETMLNENWDKVDDAVGNKVDLQTTQKDNLVGAINEVKTKADEAFQAGVDRKTEVVDALNSKKTITASTIADLWSALVQKIRDIKEGSGNALKADVLTGKTFTNNDGTEYTGTMPNNGAVTQTLTLPTSSYTVPSGYHNGTGKVSVSMNDNGAVAIMPGTTNKAIAQGYHNGSGYVAGDADLASANIKAGKNIFGVAGNSNVIDTSAGDATATNILSGKKAYVDGALVTGTMANKTGGYVTDSLTLSGNELRMSIDSAGYFSDGAYLKYTDNDWIEDNIKKGVNIFGKAGSYDALPYTIIFTAFNRLYHCDTNTDNNYELNVNTLAVINTVTSTSIGIGGVQDRLYYSNYINKRNYEINVDTMAVIHIVDCPSAGPCGIGGTQDRLYYCDNSNGGNKYELNVDTLVAINTVASSNSYIDGIGGIQDRLYNCNLSTDSNYELNVNTLAVINTIASPNSSPNGIGGTQDRLYHCDSNLKNNYELNVDTLVAINTISSPNSKPSGIGGSFQMINTLKINYTPDTTIEKIIYNSKNYFEEE